MKRNLFRMRLTTVCGGCLALFLLAAVAETSESRTTERFHVENGKLVVDTPFDFEIGSTAYAKAMGKNVESYRNVRKDPKTGAVITNWNYYAAATLARPYFGATNAWLTFSGEEKTLEYVDISFGRSAKKTGESLTFTDCTRLFDSVAKDIAARTGDENFGSEDGDVTEADALDNLDEATKRSEERRRKGDQAGAFSISLRYATTVATEPNGGGADYDLIALVNSDKTYSLSLRKHRSYGRSASGGPVSEEKDGIRVYTNQPHKVGFALRTPDQEAAHAESAKLRATIKRLFAVDLDAPSTTNDLSASITAYTNAPAVREWRPLEKPFAGLDERKTDQALRFLMFTTSTFSVRKAYDDADEATLVAACRSVLAALEREYGAKIPAIVKPVPSEKEEPSDAAPPALGDWKAMSHMKNGPYFSGRVGDLVLSIKYAPPSYVKRNGTYEIAQRGAVVVNFIQSSMFASIQPKGETK